MQLKVSSPEKHIFEWEILKVTLPTENGQITLLPWHMPLVSVVKPGLISISLAKKESQNLADFVVNDNTITLSVAKGIVYVSHDKINLVASSATTKPTLTTEELQQKKDELQAEIQKLKAEGSIEKIEESLIQLEKIKADMKLARVTG